MTARSLPAAGLLSRPSAVGRVGSALLLTAALASCPLEPAALELSCIIAVAAALATSAAPRLARVLPGALVLLSVGVAPLALTAGPERAALSLVRGMTAVVVTVAVAGSLSLSELPSALRGLGLPVALTSVLTSALRQTTVLRDEAARLLLARRLRGAATYHRTGAILGALLSRALLRAERVELAMALRGYSPHHATQPSRPSRGDVPLLLLSAIAGASVHLVGHLDG